MSDDLELMLVLEKTNYKNIYYPTYGILIALIIFIVIIFSFRYQTYYVSMGKVVDDKLELLVKVNDVSHVKNHHSLEIMGKTYSYRVNTIDDKLYVLDDYSNYQKIYLEIYKFKELDNYVCEVKIPKENKRIVTYIINYFK